MVLRAIATEIDSHSQVRLKERLAPPKGEIDTEFNSLYLLMAETKKSPKKSDKQYPCKEKGCDKVYKSASALSQHKKKKHSVEALALKMVKESIPALSKNEEDFCLFFASDREMFGNGVQSYIEAFNIEVVNKPDPDDPNQKTYKQCQYQAQRLLSNLDILKKIDEIFEGRGSADRDWETTSMLNASI